MPEIASPPASPVQESLDRLRAEIATLSDGLVATYIPELAKARPDWFGICLVTANGSVYESGDTRIPFSIQSISKPFVYGLALEDQGRASVMEKVGVEPTGDAFNSISLEPGTGRPRNPMINAGAIATTGLVLASSPERRFRRVVDTLSLYAGRPLDVDEAVFRSECDTGHRNRAIGHMLRNFGILDSDPIPVVEGYFRQCAISVTCRDLGLMAATLANRGVHPLTGKQALRGEYVESVLSIMETCGMYDSAGRWVFEVGMPAKSGVSGGVIAVLPGQLGIGVFSPPLDPQGNSVRGIRTCRDLSRYLDLHLLNRPPLGRLAIRRSITGRELGSNRVRTAEERSSLRDSAAGVRLYQLQEHLTFATTEAVVADILTHGPELRILLIDLKRVLSVSESASYMLHQLIVSLRARSIDVGLAGAQAVPQLLRYLRRKFGSDFDSQVRVFNDTDRALEWAENWLLGSGSSIERHQQEVPLRACEMLVGLAVEDVARLEKELERMPFDAGRVLVEKGSAAEELYLLVQGTVSVLIPDHSGEVRRLATFTPGMSFGEMALIDRSPRSARVVADTPGACFVLHRRLLESLSQTHPQVSLAIMRNLCLALSTRLRKANAAVAALD